MKHRVAWRRNLLRIWGFYLYEPLKLRRENHGPTKCLFNTLWISVYLYRIRSCNTVHTQKQGQTAQQSGWQELASPWMHWMMPSETWLPLQWMICNTRWNGNYKLRICHPISCVNQNLICNKVDGSQMVTSFWLAPVLLVHYAGY